MLAFRDYAKRLYQLLEMRLFSTTKYKIYMKTNLSGVSWNNMALKSLSDIYSSEIKPIEVKAPFGKSMLVIAPHQDDEMIGCGGAILSQLAAGGDVSLLFVYDGGSEFKSLGYSTRLELVKVRENEARIVAQKLGISEPKFLRVTGFDNNLEILAKKLEAQVKIEKFDSIFTPFFLDGHPEHRSVTLGLGRVLKEIKRELNVFGYEVWTSCIPNVILNIDKFMERKKELIAVHQSQCIATDYVNTTQGLNMYNARMLGKKCRYAEKYFQVPREEFVNIADQVNKTVERIS